MLSLLAIGGAPRKKPRWDQFASLPGFGRRGKDAFDRATSAFLSQLRGRLRSTVSFSTIWRQLWLDS
jgi:hypothetical protein